MNPADIIVLVAVVAAAAIAVTILRSNKKNGKSICGCDCGSGCTGNCSTCSQSCKKSNAPDAVGHGREKQQSREVFLILLLFCCSYSEADGIRCQKTLSGDCKNFTIKRK